MGNVPENGQSTWARHRASMSCQEAAQRKQDFEVGVFADPVYFGQFPDSVRARVPYLPEIPDELVLSLSYLGFSANESACFVKYCPPHHPLDLSIRLICRH